MKKDLIFTEKLLSYMSPDTMRTRVVVSEKPQCEENAFELEGFEYFEEFSGLHSKATGRNY